MIRENWIKKALREGKSAIGTFAKCNDPAVVEVLGYAGFDFIVIDNEHTAMNKENMVNLIRAANISGMVPTVRVRENSQVEILQALDAGAYGVQVPNVDTKEQAVGVVKSVKYAPQGYRGYAASQRSAAYGFVDPARYAVTSNDNTMVTCYCETLTAMENLDEIVTVEGVDIIFIGPFDLSQSLGVIGQTNHPKVLESIDTITRKVRAANKAAGIIASDAAQAQMWIDKGLQYIVLSSDLGMIGSLGKRFMKELGR